MIYNPRASLLWWSQSTAAAGFSTNLSGAGTIHSGDIDLRDVCDVWLAVVVTGTSSGTSPTLDVWLDLKEAGGSYLTQALHAPQITAGPGSGQASAGIHIASTGSMTLPEYGRITVTLGGTSPVFPGVSISLYGR